MTERKARAFNVFEGFRRLTWIAALVVIAVAAWNLVYPDPYVQAVIKLEPSTTPTLIEDCPPSAQREYVWAEESPIEGVSIQGCFVNIFGAHEDAPLRRAAMKDSRLTQHLISDIERLASNKRAESREATLKYSGIALVLLFGITYMIGWIARGFFGIPRGSDFRP